jgi:hypothetical protein
MKVKEFMCDDIVLEFLSKFQERVVKGQTASG